MNPQFFDILRRAIFLIFGLTSLSCAIWHWRRLRLLNREIIEKGLLETPIVPDSLMQQRGFYRLSVLIPISLVHLVLLLMNQSTPTASRIVFAFFSAAVALIVFWGIFRLFKNDPFFFPRKTVTFRLLRNYRRRSMIWLFLSSPVLIAMSLGSAHFISNAVSWTAWPFIIVEFLALILGYISFSLLLYPGWKRAIPFTGILQAVRAELSSAPTS